MRNIKKNSYIVIKTEKGYVSDIEDGKYRFYKPPDEEIHFVDKYGEVYNNFLYENILLCSELTRDERERIEDELLDQGCKKIRFLFYECEI